jgi:hypothetical protein
MRRGTAVLLLKMKDGDQTAERVNEGTSVLWIVESIFVFD